MAEEPSGNFNLTFEEEEEEEEDTFMPIIEPTKRPSTVHQPQSSYQLSTPTSIDYSSIVRHDMKVHKYNFILIYHPFFLCRRIKLHLVIIVRLLHP